METPFQRALKRGFTTLTKASGDSITFRGVPMPAVVDYSVDDNSDGSGARPAFGARHASRIRIQGDITPAPKAGETITHGGGRSHRIKVPRRVGIWWEFDCEVS